MRKYAIAAISVVVTALPGAAGAQRGERMETVFRCALRNGKSVEVISQGGNLLYHYGTGARRELSLRGSARSGNVFSMRQRYAGPELQLRFASEGYSYIVYSMEPNRQAGANGVAGLVVMRGHRRVGDYSCRRYTEFHAGFELIDTLPQDSDTYTAM